MTKSKEATKPLNEDSKGTILQAARQLFSEKGFAATSISQIAKVAGINQSLIYHYFENKAALWKEVKAQSIAGFEYDEQSGFLSVLECEKFDDFVNEFIRSRFEFFEQNPDIRRLVNWQSLEADQNALWGACDNSTNRIYDKLQTFKLEGQISKEVDIHHLMILLFANSLNYFTYMKRFPSHDCEKGKEQFVSLVARGIIAAVMVDRP